MQQFEVIKATRNNFLQLVERLSIEQLNFVPEGSNNNIAWNFGHIIISQQILCYQRSGLAPLLDTGLIARYQKGTRPENWISLDEINLLKGYLFTLVDRLQEDKIANKFEHYETITTQYGVKLAGIDDAINFAAAHDAWHYGWSSGLARLTAKQFSDFQYIKISN